MPLTPNTKLGPYEILSPLGAGGMGEVYKAKDTRLGRTVAIKVLPSHLSDNVRLKERFEREARAVSSLNHPHICTLHDIGSENGIDFMVMEHIEGEMLADRLVKGPLPHEEALRYGGQVAEALDKAHRAGVVHRDLKPGNIMLTKAGVKLLDFGLAKLGDPRGETVGSALPTRQKPLTEEGFILGTFQYMAPEQLEGKEADERTDLFAFGAVLYEMLTGKRAFEGKSQASLIAAIMEREPKALSELKPMTPPALERLVKRCLAKDPDDRWQSARDLALEVKWIAEAGVAGSDATPKVTERAVWLNRWMGVAAGAAAVGILFWAFFSAPPAERSVSRLVMNVGPAEELGTGDPLTQTAMVFSPDGSELVFVGWRDGVQQLYVRSLDQYEARPLSGTEGAVNPFFSPDGEWVGFWASGVFKRIPYAGGSPVTVCALSVPPWGATWTEDGTIIFAARTGGGGLLQVPSTGGSPSPLTTLDSGRGEATHRLPASLPGRRAVLFTVRRGRLWDTSEIVVASLDTGERKVIVEEGADARYVSTGHLVYAHMGTLMAVPFDIERLQVTGDAVALIDGVEQAVHGSLANLDSGAAQFSVAPSGTLAYVPGGVFPQDRRHLVWVDRTGGVERLDVPARPYWWPRLSPDGDRIALYDRSNFVAEVVIHDVRRGALTLLTPGGQSQYPVWTSDGAHVVYSEGDNMGIMGLSPIGMIRGNLYWAPVDGSGAAERLLESEGLSVPGGLSPDGRTLIYMASHPDTGADIWVLSMDGEREPRPLLQGPSNEFEPSFSPNGKWLAYISAFGQFDPQVGNWTDGEVYVQPYPGPGPVVQISTSGGQEPVWAKDGRELFYRSLNPQQVMAVTIDTSSGLTASRPRALFEDPFLRGQRRNYDVAADGRFLMIRREPMEWEAPKEIHIVQNWTKELEERVVPTR